MVKAMIVSLGGSPEPVAVSINTYKPQVVYFFCSQQSLDKVSIVKDALTNEFQDYKVVIDDINDLLACYKGARQCAEKLLLLHKFSAAEIVVDYTGGSKPMSAALVLATVTYGFKFSYIGGGKRTKNGLGTVIDGTEKVFSVLSPWEILAVRERDKINLLFNHYRFDAAKIFINEAYEKIGNQSPHYPLFKSLDYLVEGYSYWDRFQHKQALNSLRRGLSQLKTFVQIKEDTNLTIFINEVADNLDFLEQLAACSDNYNNLCALHVCDLIANGKRRLEQQEFDNAVARFYRAIELLAQVRLFQRYNINTSAVAVDRLPPKFKKDFMTKYYNKEKNKIQLPMFAAYDLLAKLDDELGKRFIKGLDNLNKLLSLRNGSILAHGVTSVPGKAAEKLFVAVKEFADIKDEDMPIFPNSLKLS